MDKKVLVRILFALMLALLVTTLAACGAQPDATSEVPAPDTDDEEGPVVSGDSTLAAIRERGVLRAGVRQDQVPFSFTDESGELVGFEVDIAAEIADSLGVELELTPVNASTRIPLLTEGRIDLAAATVSHYWDRDEVVDFSIGYYFASQNVLVATDSGLTTLQQLEGLRVGTAAGAGTLEQLPERVPGVVMESYENYQDAFLALQQGVVDGIATDLPVLAGIRAQSDNPEQWTFIEEPYGGSEFGIIVPENDSDWRDYVNIELQKMWTDGRWDQLFEKWLGPETDFALTKEGLGWQMTMWAIPPR